MAQKRHTYTITFTDGTKTTFTVTNGKDGISITGTEIDENGHLIVSFSDGKKVDVGEIVDKTPDKHLVTLHLEDDKIFTQEVYDGEKIILPNDGEFAGYIIKNWHFASLDGDIWSININRVYEDIDLYAEFEYETYNVTFFDGSFGNEVANHTFTYNQPYVLPSISEKGYELKGWQTEDGTLIPNSSIWNFNDVTELYALWDSEKYTITLNPNGGTVSQETVSVTYNNDYELPIPERDGYTFLGWYDYQDNFISVKSVWNYSVEDLVLTAKRSSQERLFVLDAGRGQFDDPTYSGNRAEITIEELGLYNLPSAYFNPYQTAYGIYLKNWLLNGEAIPMSGDEFRYAERGYMVADYETYTESNNDYYLEDFGEGYLVTGRNTLKSEPKVVNNLPQTYNGRPVIGLSSEVFAYCTSLTSVIIPEGYTEIGSGCFCLCENLNAIKLPRSLLTIGDGAFVDSGISRINLPDGLTTIGSSAFSLCFLDEFIMPDSVTDVGSNCFSNGGVTGNLKISNNLAKIPDSFLEYGHFVSIEGGINVQEIGEAAFSYSGSNFEFNLQTLWPKVSKIGNYAFRSASLGSVSLNKNLREIGEGSFHTFSSDSDLILYDKVNSLGYEVFSNANLNSITILSDLSEIPNGTFKSANINSINLFGEINGLGGFSFETSTFETLVFPDSLKYIGNLAFNNCQSLKEIILPETVISIDDSAFIGCTNLTKVDISKTKVDLLWNTFSGCSNLVNVKLPQTLKTLWPYTFADNSKLENIVLPNGLEEIGEYCFEGCESLKTIYIPKSVTRIGGYAFSGCTNLTIWCAVDTRPEGYDTMWFGDAQKVIYGKEE